MTKEKPEPQVFAIMRNGHEVIRSAMKDCEVTLKGDDDEESLVAFNKEWTGFLKWMSIHGLMEDGKKSVAKGFFAVLDEEKDGIAKNSGLYEAHHKLHNAQEELEGAISGGSISKLRSAYATYMDENEKHLKVEEEVMMPMVQAIKKDGVSLLQVMRTDILPIAVSEDFPFFLKFAMEKLEKVSQEMPRARIFAHAIQFAATEGEWKEWMVHLKAGLSHEGYASISKLLEW